MLMSESHDNNSPTRGNYQVRQFLRTIHRELRDRGLTPLEAAEAAVQTLAGRDDKRTNGTIANTLNSGFPDPSEHGSILTLLYQEFLVPEARSGPRTVPNATPSRRLGRRRCRRTRIVVADRNRSVLWRRNSARSIRGSSSNLSPRGARDQCRHWIYGLVRSPDSRGRQLELMIVDSFKLWAERRLPLGDIVVTNPPYGSIVSEIESNIATAMLPPGLREMKRIPAELLGLEVAVDSLVPGGVLGAVLPQSVLTNGRWSTYRAHLYSRLDICGVVSLPEETFAPFRGVANACVIFGEKRSVRQELAQTQVPLFRSKSVGYDHTGRDSETPSDMDQASACILGDAEPAALLELGVGGLANILTASPEAEGPCIRICDIADVFCGRTPPLAEYGNEGPFLLKVGNLQRSFVSWADRKRSHVSQRFFDRDPKLHLQAGDICLTAAAHRPRYIGQKVNVIYETPILGAMPSAEILVIRLRTDAPMTPEELACYFRSESGYEQIQDIVRGSTAHLYPRDVSNLSIPLSKCSNPNEVVELFRTAAQLHSQAVVAEQQALRAAGLA